MRSLRSELGISAAASVAVFVLAVIAGQTFVAVTAPATATAAPASAMSCLERPLSRPGAQTSQGSASLCLTVDDVALTVELSSASAGDLYTAWLRFHDQPIMRQAGACPTIQDAGRVDAATPTQVDAASATEDGTVRLLRTLPGLRPAGNTELEILVVQHGPAGAAGTTDRTRGLLSWDRAWSAVPSVAASNRADAPRLLGCTAFWLRGGAELTEH